MRNKNQCPHGLIYNSFSMILFQTFTIEKLKNGFEDGNGGDVTRRESSPNSIDNQIFTHNNDIIKRYILPSFKTKIIISEPEDDEEDKEDDKDSTVKEEARTTTIEGLVEVRAAIFFDKTVQISYRIVVEKEKEDEEGENKQGDKKKKEKKIPNCTSSQPLNTNEIISLASMLQYAEHWSLNKKDKKEETQSENKGKKIDPGDQEIHQTVSSIEIYDLKINNTELSYSSSEKESYSPKDVFTEVCSVYRKLFDPSQPEEQSESHNYTLIDVWEDVDHDVPIIDFDQMGEDEIIEHIETCHKAELVGILSLYPYEWPYRADSSYEDICGRNIAIDVDDLVLANQNVCLVFGTYGKRGEEAETDWEKHLEVRNIYNTSWPEYLVLLELLIAKKQAIRFIMKKYMEDSKVIEVNSTDELIKQIERNATDNINMTNMLLELDATRYLRFVSHKHMYKLTAENMNINEDEQYLNQIISNIDNALINTNNIIQMRQSEMTKNVLIFISIASLFSVLMENDNIPVLSLVAPNLSKGITVVLEIITFTAIIYGCHKLYLSLKGNRNKRKLQDIKAKSKS